MQSKMCSFSLWFLTSGSVEVVGWHSCKLGPRGVGCLMGIFKGICRGMIYCRSPFEAGVRGLFVPAAPVIIIQVMTKVKESERERDASPVGSTCLITDFSRTTFYFLVMFILLILVFQLVVILLCGYQLQSEVGVKDPSLPDVAYSYRISTRHPDTCQNTLLCFICLFSFPVIFHASYLPLTAQ